MFPTTAAVAAVLLAVAPPAAAGPGYAVSSVVRTVVRLGWSADADGIYRVTAYQRPYAITVVLPYELSSSSRASASRR